MKFAIVTVAAALLLAGCNTSYNYFQEEAAEDTGRDTSLFGTALTMTGIIPPQTRPIDYSPRAPIAVPSTSELPTPGSGRSVHASVNFPEDQDSAEARRRQTIRDTLAGPDVANDYRENPSINMTPEEMQAGRRAGGGLNRGPLQLNANPFGNRSANLSQDQMKIVVRAPRAGGEVLTEDGGAAPRKYLIQPPNEYRTPSATAPLPDRKEIENSQWAEDRLYGIKDRTPRRLQE